MTSKVFISHSLKDKALYSSLCVAFDGAGIPRKNVWALTPGEPLADALRAAIQECDVCVFLATARSVQSGWCLAELGAFWGAGKRVITYLAEPEIAESSLPPQFHGNLWTADANELVSAIKKVEPRKVHRLANGYCVNLGRMTIRVVLGRIEESECDESSLVALPANEYFDDDCIHDTHSALGAYMQHHFKGRIPEIQELVARELASEPSNLVTKRPGVTAASYGVGKCVFLDFPLASRKRIAMIAVTTQRTDVGLRADAAGIFDAAAAIQRVMANHRLTRLFVPVLGSGHGGLREEVSLACMLIAFGELQRKSASSLKEVNIVVFRRDQDADCSVSEETIRRALDFASRDLTE